MHQIIYEHKHATIFTVGLKHRKEYIEKTICITLNNKEWNSIYEFDDKTKKLQFIA
jgi:hypothetical protein